MSPAIPASVFAALEQVSQDPHVLELIRHVKSCAAGCSYSLEGVAYCDEGSRLAGAAGLGLLAAFLSAPPDKPARNPLAGKGRTP